MKKREHPIRNFYKFLIFILFGINSIKIEKYYSRSITYTNFTNQFKKEICQPLRDYDMENNEYSLRSGVHSDVSIIIRIEDGKFTITCESLDFVTFMCQSAGMFGIFCCHELLYNFFGLIAILFGVYTRCLYIGDIYKSIGMLEGSLPQSV
jgi:hypothetical protein